MTKDTYLCKTGIQQWTIWLFIGNVSKIRHDLPYSKHCARVLQLVSYNYKWLKSNTNSGLYRSINKTKLATPKRGWLMKHIASRVKKRYKKLKMSTKKDIAFVYYHCEEPKDARAFISCCKRRASMKTSKFSPSITSWMEWCVIPTRWSVTRPCGKLYVRIRSDLSPLPIYSKEKKNQDFELLWY